MKNKLAVFAALCGLFVLAAASAQAVAACRSGLALCVELILPSLFPFFVLSGLLSRLGLPAMLGERLSGFAEKAFRVSGAGCTALLLGLLGGYPLGAAYIAGLRESGAVGGEEAGHLLAFCNNSGPAFFLGALGTGVFGSARCGLRLYAVHAAAAVLTGLLLRGRAPAASAAGKGAPPLPFPQALTEAVRQAVSASLGVCGFVVCFAVFTGLLNANGFTDLLAGRLSELSGQALPWCRALLTGLFELGGGIGALRGLAPTPANLALAAGLMGWGGVSVQFQTLSLIADTDIKSAPHTAGRLLSAMFGYALAYGLGSLLQNR